MENEGTGLHHVDDRSAHRAGVQGNHDIGLEAFQHDGGFVAFHVGNRMRRGEIREGREGAAEPGGGLEVCLVVIEMMGGGKWHRRRCRPYQDAAQVIARRQAAGATQGGRAVSGE